MTASANLVKELREKTGAGMMDCKKALQETSGDFEKAIDWLRQKGLSAAAKKSSRQAAEGLVHAYIHGEGRIGVLLEVNSETDFVARNEQFKGLVKDLAMQIAAANPICVDANEFPQDALEREKRVLAAKAQEEGKPANMIDKIVDGQIKKYMAANCLLEQNFIKDPDKKVTDIIKAAISTIGENIVVRRFVRYELGEGIEKKKTDFAAEVAAQLKG